MPPQGAENISQRREAEETTGGRDSLVLRNLPTLSIKATSLGVSSSDIPPQGASGSSKPVDWEQIILAHHNREMMVPANLRTRVYVEPLSGPKAHKGVLRYGPPFES
jgi:hypothetical protein